MKVVKQKTEFSVCNFDEYTGGGTVSLKNKNGPLLPDSIRALIVGPSSSGKTNLLFNLLIDPNGLRFENVYIFSKSLYQPKYKLLATVMPKEIGYFTFDEHTAVIHPGDAKPNSVMIFDDIAMESNKNTKNFYTMGRHRNVDTFYLGQTYSHIPKQLVRDNSNFIILFKQDDKNLRHAYNDHVNTDMSFDKFKQLCGIAWKDNHGFIVISKDNDLDKGRYRVGLDSFVQEL